MDSTGEIVPLVVTWKFPSTFLSIFQFVVPIFYTTLRLMTEPISKPLALSQNLVLCGMDAEGTDSEESLTGLHAHFVEIDTKQYLRKR